MLLGRHSKLLREMILHKSKTLVLPLLLLSASSPFTTITPICLSSEKFKQDLQIEVYLFTEHDFEAKL